MGHLPVSSWVSLKALIPLRPSLALTRSLGARPSLSWWGLHKLPLSTHIHTPLTEIHGIIPGRSHRLQSGSRPVQLLRPQTAGAALMMEHRHLGRLHLLRMGRRAGM